MNEMLDWMDYYQGYMQGESMRRHFGLTFHKHTNTTLDKQAAQNLNIIRQWSLSIMKPIENFQLNQRKLLDLSFSLWIV